MSIARLPQILQASPHSICVKGEGGGRVKTVVRPRDYFPNNQFSEWVVPIVPVLKVTKRALGCVEITVSL